MTDLHGFAFFCDDIRQEVGGKTSYMGCYSNALLVPGGFPTSLPQLGIVAHAVIPRDLLGEVISFDVYLPGESQEQPSMTVELTGKLPDGVSDMQEGNAPWHTLTVQQQGLVRNLALLSEGTIRVTARVGSREIPLGRLEVRALANKGE